MKATSLYLHFPLCKHVCSYCDFNVRAAQSFQGFENLWIDATLRHLSDRAAEISEGGAERGHLKTLYLGGGTPSLLSARGFDRLLEGLSKNFTFDTDWEFTLEANPETLTEKSLRFWHDRGVNRLSIGVQSFQPQILLRLERLATAEHLKMILEEVPRYFKNFSIDLMIGVPDQTMNLLEEDLKLLKQLNSSHLSIYMLTIAPDHKWLQSASMRPRLANDETVSLFYSRICEQMLESGYRHYEISNFAKPGFESRHNSNYWNIDSPYLAIGPGAHGYQISGDRRIRYQMISDLNAWANHKTGVESLEELTAEQQRLERLYLGLRTGRPIARSDLVAEALNAALQENAARLSNDFVFLTEKGWLFMEWWASKLIP